MRPLPSDTALGRARKNRTEQPDRTAAKCAKIARANAIELQIVTIGFHHE